jgi:hypothetical protein
MGEIAFNRDVIADFRDGVIITPDDALARLQRLP